MVELITLTQMNGPHKSRYEDKNLMDLLST